MIRLVPDWRDWRHWYSQHANLVGAVFTALAGALIATGAAVPWFSAVDTSIAFFIATAIFIAGFIGRLIQQNLGQHSD